MQSITQKTTFDGFGRVKTVVTNPNETALKKESEFFYDGSGKVLNQKEKIAGALVSDTVYTYDDFGKSARIRTVHDLVSGISKTFEYQDPAKRLTLAKTQEAGGVVLEETRIDTQDYDLFDRANKVTKTVDGLGRFTQEARYNAFGELESSRDARGNFTTYQYDFRKS